LNTSKSPKPGDEVLVLHPQYVAGKIGVIDEKETLSSGKQSGRWLVRIESENLMLSLSSKEFQVLDQH
jgi:hypothetical protein